MPLVTRQSNQGNLWKEASTPNWATNDIWVDTDDGKLYVNVSGSATEIARQSAIPSDTNTSTARTIALG